MIPGAHTCGEYATEIGAWRAPSTQSGGESECVARLAEEVQSADPAGGRSANERTNEMEKPEMKQDSGRRSRRTSRPHALPALMASALCTLTLAGCEAATGPEDGVEAAPPLEALTSPAITSMRGAGTLGYGETTADGGVSRQSFDFNVGIDNGLVQGTMVYIDSAVVKVEDNEPAELRVGDEYPGTEILSFVQTSATCVEFDGTGYLVNTGELLAFKAEACDNGSPGVDADFFGLRVPQRFLTHGQEYYRADLLSSGDIIATLLGLGEVEITRISGSGTLGDGEPVGDGIALQEFTVDVGLESGTPGGSMEYTDHASVLNGAPAQFRAALDEEGTAVTGFTQVSSTCVDFSGVGRLVNTDELLQFRARACDNGSPGTDTDVFGIWVREKEYQRGPDLLSDGELVSETLDG